MTINVSHTLEITPTISTSIYADGDVVGGLLDLRILCGGGGGGTIRQVRLVDDDSEGVALYLYLFDGKPTTIADQAAFAAAITVADLKKMIGRISIAAADYLTINTNDVVWKDDINLPHGTGELWGYLVTNGSTPTYTAVTDLTLTVVGWKD